MHAVIGDSVSTARRQTGFTLVEMGIVMALVGVIALISAPSLGKLFASQRLTDSAHRLAGAFSYARGEAIRTGNVHLVLLGVDASGTALTDGGGDPIDVLVVDDGRLGSTDQNCKFDLGETITPFNFEDGTTWGVTKATGTVATDNGSSTITAGSSLLDGGGNPARWVMFRNEGPAHGFTSTCTIGAVGSGGGAAYLTNGDRDVAVVVTPLGATRMHRWADGGWTN